MSRARRVTSAIVALAVVVGTTYGAAALLSPVPRLQAVERPIDLDASWSETLTLPESGSTAALTETGSIASAGSADPRPIAGVAKVVLLNVVLATDPLALGSPGPALMIDQQAVDRYRELSAVGARTVAVGFGQTWTRHDLIAATLLGSANNTAELLIDDVFGDLEGYLTAANAWLADQGLTQSTVVDGTGLDAGSRSTADDLARLGQLTIEHPVLGDLLERRPRDTSAGVRFVDQAAFVADAGTIGIVRSYTDAAAVCVLMIVPITVAGVGTELVSVAMLGQPSYPQAERAAREIVASLGESVRAVEVISAGQLVAELQSEWGQSTTLVAGSAVTVSSTDLEGLNTRLELAPRSTIVRGTDAGSLVVTARGADQVVRLTSTGGISEPGVAWRFADPLTVIQRWTR